MSSSRLKPLPPEFPTSCFTCKSTNYSDSVLLRCDCMIFLCQKCAIADIVNNPSTYHNGFEVACPMCGLRKPIFQAVDRVVINDYEDETCSLIETTEPSKLIASIQRLESDLVLSAFARFNIQYSVNIDKNSLLEVINAFTLENEQFSSLTLNCHDLSQCQLTLLISRLEESCASGLVISSNVHLPLGPLKIITIQHNTWFERIMGVSSFNFDDKCSICGRENTTYDPLKCALFDCECGGTNGVACVDCAIRTISFQPRTFHDGLMCITCHKKPSYPIDGFDEALAFEKQLIESITKFFRPRAKKAADPSELLSKCKQLGFIKDDFNSNYRVMRLELARAECLRQLVNKYLNNNLTLHTTPKEIKAVMETHKLVATYLPLGPLDKLKITRNVFLDIAIRLVKYPHTNFVHISDGENESPTILNHYSEPMFEESDIPLTSVNNRRSKSPLNVKHNKRPLNSMHSRNGDGDQNSDSSDKRQKSILIAPIPTTTHEIIDYFQPFNEMSSTSQLFQTNNFSSEPSSKNDINPIEKKPFITETYTNSSEKRDPPLDVKSHPVAIIQTSEIEQTPTTKNYTNTFDFTISEYEILRCMINAKIYNENNVMITKLEDLKHGYLEGDLVCFNKSEVTQHIKIEFSDWLIYPGQNSLCSMSPCISLGDVIFFEVTDDSSQRIYKLVLAHASFSSTMRSIQAFSANFTQIMSQAEAYCEPNSRKERICKLSFEDVVEACGDLLNKPLVYRYLPVIYSQLYSARTFRSTCNFMASLHKLVHSSSKEAETESSVAITSSSNNKLVPTLSSVSSLSSNHLQSNSRSTSDKVIEIPSTTRTKSQSAFSVEPLISKNPHSIDSKSSASTPSISPSIVPSVSQTHPIVKESKTATISNKSTSSSTSSLPIIPEAFVSQKLSDETINRDKQIAAIFKDIDFKKKGKFKLYFSTINPTMVTAYNIPDTFELHLQVAFSPFPTHSASVSASESLHFYRDLNPAYKFSFAVMSNQCLKNLKVRLKYQYQIHVDIEQFCSFDGTTLDIEEKRHTFEYYDIEPNSTIYLCPSNGLKLPESVSYNALSLLPRDIKNKYQPPVSVETYFEEIFTVDDIEEIDDNSSKELLKRISCSIQKYEVFITNLRITQSSSSYRNGRYKLTVGIKSLHKELLSRARYDVNLIIEEAIANKKNREAHMLQPQSINAREIESLENTKSLHDTDSSNINKSSPLVTTENLNECNDLKSNNKSGSVIAQEEDIEMLSESPNYVDANIPSQTEKTAITPSILNLHAKQEKYKNIDFKAHGSFNLYIYNEKNPSKPSFEDRCTERSANGSFYINLKVFFKPYHLITAEEKLNNIANPPTEITYVTPNMLVKKLRDSILDQLAINADIVECKSLVDESNLNMKCSLHHFRVKVGSLAIICPLKESPLGSKPILKSVKSKPIPSNDSIPKISDPEIISKPFTTVNQIQDRPILPDHRLNSPLITDRSTNRSDAEAKRLSPPKYRRPLSCPLDMLSYYFRCSPCRYGKSCRYLHRDFGPNDFNGWGNISLYQLEQDLDELLRISEISYDDYKSLMRSI